MVQANTSFPSTDIKKVSKESESQRSKVHESFYFTVLSYLQPEKFKIFCRDFFHALRSFITRDCMYTPVILSIFSYTWYWLQNRIFLTVSDNYWILNRKIQAGIRQTCIFRTPLSPVLITNGTHNVANTVESFDSTKAWEFLFHGSLLYTAGEIQDFLPRFFPCSSKFYYKGLYGHISDFEHFS